ncbi:SET domain-containing protein [Fragilaria crotonensis]|nr:SET domain-containing protein [Fragilaria crotonensis]
MPSLESFQMPRFWSTQRLELVTDGGQLERELETDRLRYRQDPWSLACVDSRCHFLPNGGYSLTPVLDMINHNPTVKTSLRVERVGDENAIGLDVAGESLVFNDQPETSMVPSSWMDRLFQTKSPTDPIRSKEVNISYGDFSNIHTLLNYGFVFPGNPSNRETLVIRLIRMQSPVVLVVKSDGSIEEDGLGRLRRAIASTDEREIIEFLPDNQKNPLLFVSKRNEEDVLALVAGELEVAIEQSCEGALLAKDDRLVALYLDERTQSLRRALNRIHKSAVE